MFCMILEYLESILAWSIALKNDHVFYRVKCFVKIYECQMHSWFILFFLYEGRLLSFCKNKERKQSFWYKAFYCFFKKIPFKISTLFRAFKSSLEAFFPLWGRYLQNMGFRRLQQLLEVMKIAVRRFFAWHSVTKRSRSGINQESTGRLSFSR